MKNAISYQSHTRTLLDQEELRGELFLLFSKKKSIG